MEKMMKWLLLLGIAGVGILVVAAAVFILVGMRIPQVSQAVGGMPSLEYVVDATVSPVVSTLPGYDGGESRPVAAIAGDDGEAASYVANEIIVSTADTASLGEIVDSYGGKVLFKIDPAARGIAGLAPLYVVRVDPSKADLSRFADDIQSLSSQRGSIASGKIRFSSQEGVGLMAIAARQARAGRMIGVNWLGTGNPLPGSSIEAPAGPDGYDPDAYHWDYFRRGSPMDIGVPEAWSLMARTGALNNRVKIAILDGGFAPDDDFRPGTIFSVIPWISDPLNHENPGECGGPCPWHATSVMSTAMAIADNSYGAAGTAGPVGEPIMILTNYDLISAGMGVLEARSNGARIINMSFTAKIPWYVDWSVLPFEDVTEAVRNSGVLIFASAGNDSADVDYKTCGPLGIICWEKTMYTPCENKGVICVGGVRSYPNDDDVGIDSGSNWGWKSVDIYAPFTVYVGPDPENPGNAAHFVSGTSFSSPYAAGVAALVWAANPSLSADEVWQVLYDTSHAYYNVHWPNAYAAVLSQIPETLTVELTSPSPEGTFEMNQPVSFSAEVVYVSMPGNPIALHLSWIDNGAIFYEQNVNLGRTSENGIHSMPVFASSGGFGQGRHAVRVVADAIAGGPSAYDEISFEVGNTRPTVEIHQPAEGASFCSGQTVMLRGSAIDLGDIRIGIPDNSFRWFSTLMGGGIGVGPSYGNNVLPVGRQRITLQVTDSEGAVGEASRTITILDAADVGCSDLPPEVKIIKPVDLSKYTPEGTDEKGKFITVELLAEVTDREDAESDLTIEWSSDVEGFLGSGKSLTVKLHAGTLSTTHVITVSVTDTGGYDPVVDSVRITIEIMI